MPACRLTSYEQEKLYQAVLAHEQGYWKSCSDSVLAVFSDYVAYPIDAIRHGKSIDTLKFIDEGIHFKETYARMKREYLQLKRRKLLLVSRNSERVIVRLTDKGFLRLAKRMLKQGQQPLPDGQSLFVAFDIPESAHLARSMFRRFLKSSGFRMTQKSIWATPFDVRKAIAIIIGELGITDWVSVIVGSTQTAFTQKRPVGRK